MFYLGIGQHAKQLAISLGELQSWFQW